MLTLLVFAKLRTVAATFVGKLTGDRVKVDLRNRRVDALITDEEIEARWAALEPVALKSDSPWQELFRAHVGQLETGACLEFAVKYRDLRKTVPRHSH